MRQCACEYSTYYTCMKAETGTFLCPILKEVPGGSSWTFLPNSSPNTDQVVNTNMMT